MHQTSRLEILGEYINAGRWGKSPLEPKGVKVNIDLVGQFMVPKSVFMIEIANLLLGRVVTCVQRAFYPPSPLD